MSHLSRASLILGENTDIAQMLALLPELQGIDLKKKFLFYFVFCLLIRIFAMSLLM